MSTPKPYGRGTRPKSDEEWLVSPVCAFIVPDVTLIPLTGHVRDDFAADDLADYAVQQMRDASPKTADHCVRTRRMETLVLMRSLPWLP
jgi:hypothetical protein